MGDQEKLERLGALARAAIPGDVNPAHEDAERARFVAAVTRGAARPGSAGAGAAARGVLSAARARPRRVMTLAAAAALSVAVVALWPAQRLDYAVEGATAAQGEYVAAPPSKEARLRFTDGSSVALSPGSALRVADIAPEGARMHLEHGRAALAITRRANARWSIEAGPFAVLVTGTAFDVDWSASEGTLRVDLREGTVTVRGPLTPDGLPLRAGQHLVARLREGDVQITSGDGAAPMRAESSSPAPSAALQRASDEENAPRIEPPEGSAQQGDEAAEQQGSSRAGGAPASPPVQEAAGLSWTKRVAAGEFREVLAEAEQRGLGAVLDRGALDDLTAVADAARYAKRGDLAHRALSATRRRFPGTPQGKAAAFLVGRLVDDGGSPGAAIGWYDTYLRESPSGQFAAEALGRKMMAVSRTEGRDAARTLADQYLARFPRGAHASLARDLVKP